MFVFRSNEGGGQSNFPQNISFSYMLEEQQCNLPDHKITAGCTAVVALVVDREIIVANAGDSKVSLTPYREIGENTTANPAL